MDPTTHLNVPGTRFILARAPADPADPHSGQRLAAERTRERLELTRAGELEAEFLVQVIRTRLLRRFAGHQGVPLCRPNDPPVLQLAISRTSGWNRVDEVCSSPLGFAPGGAPVVRVRFPPGCRLGGERSTEHEQHAFALGCAGGIRAAVDQN